MGARDMCYVRGCRSRRYKNLSGISYHKLPDEPSDRREDWIKFTKRTSSPRQGWRICSKHFVSGKPSKDARNIDHIPSLRPPRKKKSTDSKQDSNIPILSLTRRTSGSEGGIKTTYVSDKKTQFSLKEEYSDSGKDIGTTAPLPCPEEESQIPLADIGGTVKPEICIKEEHVNDVSDDDNRSESDGSSYVTESDDEQNKKPQSRGLCNICCKDFRIPCRLREHMRTHIGEKRKRKAFNQNAMCPMCGQIYKRRTDLEHHIERVHERNASEDSICPICRKLLANRYAVSRHIKSVHSDQREYKCVLCGKSYATSQAVRRHMKSHGEKPTYSCTQCCATFKLVRTLRLHEYRAHGDRSVIGQKDYKCPICDKTFLIRERLNSHMVIHREGSHKCPTCDRSFKHRSNLRTHIRSIHYKEASFQCPYCARCFSNLYNLKVHKRIHTGEKPYSCTNCGKQFSDVCNFRRHQARCACLKEDG